MSFPNADLFPMNQNILSVNLDASMTSADMDRSIDSALDCFGIGWSDSPTGNDCISYLTCIPDVDQQGCPSNRGL